MVSFPSEKPTADPNDGDATETTTIIAKKDAQGNWKPVKAVAKPDGTVEYQEIPESELPDGVEVANDGTITIPENAVKDGGTISAIGREEGKTNSPAATDTTKEDGKAADPIINHGKGPDGTTPDGSLSITPAPSNEKVAFSYNNENTPAQETSVIVEKKSDGSGYTLKTGPKGQETEPAKDGSGVYTNLPQGMEFDPQTGEVSLDKQSVKDDQVITVTASEKKEDGVNDRDPAEVTPRTNDDRFVPPTVDRTPSPYPTTKGTAQEQATQRAANDKVKGGVTVTAGEDNVKLEVSFISESNNNYTLTYTRADLSSNWVLSTIKNNTHNNTITYTNVDSLPEDLYTTRYNSTAKVNFVTDIDQANGTIKLHPNALRDQSEVTVKGYSIADTQSAHVMDDKVMTTIDTLPNGSSVIFDAPNLSGYIKVGALAQVWQATAAENMPETTLGGTTTNRIVVEVQGMTGGTKYFVRSRDNEYSDVVKTGDNTWSIGQQKYNMKAVTNTITDNFFFDGNDLYINKSYLANPLVAPKVIMHTGYSERVIDYPREYLLNNGETFRLDIKESGVYYFKKPTGVNETATVDLGANGDVNNSTLVSTAKPTGNANQRQRAYGSRNGLYEEYGTDDGNAFKYQTGGNVKLYNTDDRPNSDLYRYADDDRGVQILVYIESGVNII